MTSVVEPSIEVYGTYARESALADYLELLAYHGQSLTRAALADLIHDNQWTRKRQELFNTPTPEATDEDGVDEELETQYATHVFDVIAERVDVLGDRYPFRLADDRERIEPRLALKDAEVYFFLLAVCTAHSYRLDTTDDPRELFQTFVADALGHVGLLAVDLAAHRRGQTFREAVIAAGQAIELNPTPERGASRVYAHDEGVDSLAHLYWGDHRPGQWVFIGQATCAQSDEWAAKGEEPSSHQWAKYLGLLVDPLPFLALPHHVEGESLYWLTEKTAELVLDRLRLCHSNASLRAEQRRCVEEVLAVDVWAP